jgi:hypothetical protein
VSCDLRPVPPKPIHSSISSNLGAAAVSNRFRPSSDKVQHRSEIEPAPRGCGHEYQQFSKTRQTQELGLFLEGRKLVSLERTESVPLWHQYQYANFCTVAERQNEDRRVPVLVSPFAANRV